MFRLSSRTLAASWVVVLLAGCEADGRRAAPATDSGIVEASSARTDDTPSEAATRTPVDAHQSSDAVSRLDGAASPRACTKDATDSSVAGYEVPDGPPPEDCMAPCIWNIVKDCLFVGKCTEEAPVTDATGTTSTYCAPESDGWAVAGTSTLFDYGWRREVYRGGKLCYSWSETTGRNSPPPIPMWSGANGVVAIGDGKDFWVNSVFCGTVTQIIDATKCMHDSTCDASVLPIYDVDPSQQHCAPWRSVIAAAHGSYCCQPGECAGEPPK